MKIQTHFLKLKEGVVFVKKWLPDTPNNCDSPPLILLHDSLGCVDLWKEFPELLAEKLNRTVIAYDRLGFGKSSARNELPSFNFINEEAIQYFPQIKTQLGINAFAVLGHSVGGGMAIHIASNDEDCKAVITVSAQAFVEKLTISGIKAAKAQFAKPRQIERLQKWHGQKAKWVLDAWTDIWLADEFKNWSLGPVIGKVNCPVLAIHGSNDEYGSVAFPEYIASNVGDGCSQNGNMLLLNDCGHVPHREKPEETIKAINAFLK